MTENVSKSEIQMINECLEIDRKKIEQIETNVMALVDEFTYLDDELSRLKTRFKHLVKYIWRKKFTPSFEKSNK